MSKKAPLYKVTGRRILLVVDGKVDEITIPQEERSFSNHYSSES